jgi:hypothetical protein
VLAFTAVAAADCGFGAILMAVFRVVATWPNTGVSSSAITGDVTHNGNANKAMINGRCVMVKPPLDCRSFTLP